MTNAVILTNSEYNQLITTITTVIDRVERLEQQLQQSHTLLTTHEVATMLRVSEDTVREYTKRPVNDPKHLPSQMLNGKAKAIELKDVQNLIKRTRR